MKFSLITVAYNSSKTISDTIQSVLNQTYNDIEYVIVDGNSTDNTLEIVKSYETEFRGRMRWICEPDMGLYDAMNKGIKMATGDIVGIINSDDFYHKNDIIKQVADAFIDKNVQVVFGDVRFVKNEELNKTVRYYSSKWFRPSLFRFGFMPAHPTFFTYKSNFDSFGYYKTDYKIAADYELLIRFLYSRKLLYKYIPVDFMKMRIGGKSTASFMSNIISNREIVRACKENGIYTNFPILLLKYIVKIWELILIK